MNEEVREILSQAQQEIVVLRRRVEIMHAQLEVFYRCSDMVNAHPPGKLQQGQGEDVAWKIDQVLKEAERNTLGGEEAKRGGE